MPLTLYTVKRGVWRVDAICDAAGRTFIDLLNLSDKESAKVAAVLDRIADAVKGPESIPEDRNHLIDPAARIWQLRVDECRILWFYDKGRVVICCHAYRKKSNKAPKGEVAKACAVKDAYFEAKQAGQLQFKSNGV